MNRGGLAVILLSLAIALAGVWIFSSRTASNAGSEKWVARSSPALPSVISPEDGRWEEASPLYLPFHVGSHGPRAMAIVELRALYDETRIVFWARWRGTATAQLNERFALIWHKDDLPGQRGRDCATACHVARSSSQGEIQAITPSFVPAGREEPMPTQASWRDGVWTLTWSRPLKSPEARDIQFVDLRQRYRVRAKVFLELDHKPDLLTEDVYLIFDES
jgi:hypothetical protein